MSPDPKRIGTPAVRPSEIERMHHALTGSGRLVTGDDLVKRGGRYRLVSRRALMQSLLEVVDVFVIERIRQVEAEMASLVEAREAEARSDGQYRVLVSLAGLADLIETIVTQQGNDQILLALKALDKRVDRIFKSYGFNRIGTVGSMLDLRFHEAVEERSITTAESGVILEEVARGYERDGFVLRVAKVIVAS
jgi:molecular chaperone GrpE (heat shock protein)